MSLAALSTSALIPPDTRSLPLLVPVGAAIPDFHARRAAGFAGPNHRDSIAKVHGDSRPAPHNVLACAAQHLQVLWCDDA